MQTRSLQTRLTWAFIGLAVGPLLLVGTLAVWQGVSYQTESLRLQEQLAQRVSVEAKAFLTTVENDLLLAIQLQGAQGLRSRQPFGSLFGLLSYQDVFEELTVLDRAGREVNRVARLEIITEDELGNRAGSPEWEIPITTGETYYSPVRFDDVTGEPLMTIAVAMVDERLGTTQGVLIAEVRLKKIWEIIAHTPLGAQQIVYIVDARGRVVAHRNPSVVLRGTNFTLPAQPGIATGLESMVAMVAMDEIQLGSQSLTIVAEQALGEALALPINLITTTLLVTLFAFAAASVIGLRSVRRIIRPINDLAATARAIRAGDLSRRAPVERADEVGDLAETFNTMTAQLQQTMRGLALELTERQRIADELRESEAKTRALLEAIPDTIFLLDEEARVLEFIPGLNFTPIVPPEQFIGKTVQDVLPPPLADQIRFHVDQALASHQLQIFEYLLTQGNESRFYETRMTVSGPQRVLAVVRDITAQKKSESEREALINKLEAKNAELDNFTYTVSHDLRSPLITLRGFLRYLEEDASSFNQERLQNDIQRINESVDKMERLIQELLELSRVGRLVNPPVDVPFAEIVQDALSRVQGRLQKNQVKVEVGDGLPFVHCDRNRLVQVLQNLLDNSAKFMGDQTEPHIEIGTRRQDGKHIFYVKDNGVGIKPEFHDKVFGIFDKLDMKSDGTGIGLALVKRIIQAHGGSIWIESDGIGKGTTFFFTLE